MKYLKELGLIIKATWKLWTSKNVFIATVDGSILSYHTYCYDRVEPHFAMAFFETVSEYGEQLAKEAKAELKNSLKNE